MNSHLGGHYNITHLDSGALTWAIETFDIKSMLDIGCGPGGMVKYAKAKGLKSLGIDGDPSVKNSDIIIHDFSEGPVKNLANFDLCWCVEFVEHVEEKYIDNFLSAFSNCRYIIMTHALPGQKGWHHVNCKKQDYWISKIETIGFKFEQELTQVLKDKSTMNTHSKSWEPFLKNTGLFFKKI